MMTIILINYIGGYLWETSKRASNLKVAYFSFDIFTLRKLWDVRMICLLEFQISY